MAAVETLDAVVQCRRLMACSFIVDTEWSDQVHLRWGCSSRSKEASRCLRAGGSVPKTVRARWSQCSGIRKSQRKFLGMSDAISHKY